MCLCAACSAVGLATDACVACSDAVGTDTTGDGAIIIKEGPAATGLGGARYFSGAAWNFCAQLWQQNTYSLPLWVARARALPGSTCMPQTTSLSISAPLSCCVCSLAGTTNVNICK